jgi:hypothetical protein
MKLHRKVWTDAFGPIPIDAMGRTYEIHHIDGNNKNNDISNLKCVSIKEHYEIHMSQGDYEACFRIANRMNLSSNEIHAIAVLGGKSKKGKPKKRVTCPKCGKEGNIDSMTRWHFENCGNSKPSRKPDSVICDKCGKVGSPHSMYRWHFENCGIKYSMPEAIKNLYKKPKRKIECEFCKKQIGSSGYHKHIVSCKNKTLNV